MQNDLIINFKKKEIFFALLKNEKLVEFLIYKKKKSIFLGDIYIGKIIYIYKGIKAVIIDIGYLKYGFLNYKDIGSFFFLFDEKKSIKKKEKKKVKLKVGQYIIVQILKIFEKNKGPKLTCKISLVGRYIILLPLKSKIYFSKNIKKSNKKFLIKKIKKKVPKFFGFIIRTLAVKKKIKLIKKEIKFLFKLFNLIFLKIKKKKIKKIFLNNNIVYNFLKNYSLNFNKIICNNLKFCKKIKLLIYILEKKKTKNIKYYKNNKKSIFNKYNIKKQIKILFSKKIYLSNGINLIIEKTETLNVIDINSNKNIKDFSYKINLKAIKEIVRQIILRDMGGIIIIDLINMKKKEEKKKIYNYIKKEMYKDKTKYKILPISYFNLLEITRKNKNLFFEKNLNFLIKKNNSEK
ncbi:MAG: ribonuclease E/G [Candidatus Shikimatogenerans sp. JK-2022]|nr:ribonuclease E/G [Candidatus Shikimatogenerans bostrichidophilus]